MCERERERDRVEIMAEEFVMFVCIIQWNLSKSPFYACNWAGMRVPFGDMSSVQQCPLYRGSTISMCCLY